MKKSQLKEIIKKSLKETSATGTGASVSGGSGEGVATKYAFKKKTNEVKIVNPQKDIINLLQSKHNYKTDREIRAILSNYINLPKGDSNQKIPFLNFKNLENQLEQLSSEKVTELYSKILHMDSKQQVTEGYNSFKKQVTTKTPRSSSKTAMRVIKRKLKEINQTLDYSSKLKQELGEAKINEQQVNEILTIVNEINKKLKKLYK
jgi:hypothetical protein